MSGDLLENARQQAERSKSSVRAAALLQIARVESIANVSRARMTLTDALEAIRNLPPAKSEPFAAEARRVAAAVSPEMLDDIPIVQHWGGRFASTDTVQTMLTYGHVDAAFDYLLRQDRFASFPFRSIAGVLHQLDASRSDSATRRMALLRHAVGVWQRDAVTFHSEVCDEFVQLFAVFWKEFPSEEALAILRLIVARSLEKPDDGVSASHGDDVHFTSRRQHSLFQVLHVLRHLAPELAQSLVDSHDQLAVAARRFPLGLETMHEEAEVKAQRRRLDGATCHGGGYLLGGDPTDFDRQRRLVDAMRGGDFAQSIEDALEKYREDTSPETPNYAPREYWPSTGIFRSVFYQAGKRLGADAAGLLERVPDDDLRLFASIELAAALAGAPPVSIRSMKQPRPRDAHGGGSIVASKAVRRQPLDGPTMRSPDGRLIRCPKCHFQPPADLRWSCKCGHSWNTFGTSGRCPACHFQWTVTQCPDCSQMSEHLAWLCV